MPRLKTTSNSVAQNQLWCVIVTLAAEITAWMQLFTLTSSVAPRR